MPGKRTLNVLGLLACAGMTAYALYAQHGLNLEPCPLCVLQRMSVIALGVVFALAALHNPAGWMRWIYAVGALVTGGAGVGVAGRHVWLQNLPPEKVPECGPGLDYLLDAFPLGEALSMVFSGSGECAEVDWSLLGLSMPAWVLIGLGGLTLYGIVVNARKAAR